MTLAIASPTIDVRTSMKSTRKAVALARPHLRAVVRGPRLPRLADLPGGAADPEGRRHHRWRRRSSPASRSSTASRPGCRPAASSSARVWGHGSYVAPDWSADWLHREAVALAGASAPREQRQPTPSADAADSGAVDARAAATRCGATPTTPPPASSPCRRERAQAIREVARHYDGLFGNDAVARQAARASTR